MDSIKQRKKHDIVAAAATDASASIKRASFCNNQATKLLSTINNQQINKCTYFSRKQKSTQLLNAFSASSFLLWLTTILVFNISPHQRQQATLTSNLKHSQQQQSSNNYLPTFDHQFNLIINRKDDNNNFVGLSSSVVDAKVLGKMAKVWYIKKKLKKMAKKLKKHTIAVPVFTAIPIYEHSYYPHPSLMHSAGMHHHHHAASNQVATIAEPIASAQTIIPIAAAAAQPTIQHAYHQQQQQHHHLNHHQNIANAHQQQQQQQQQQHDLSQQQSAHHQHAYHHQQQQQQQYAQAYAHQQHQQQQQQHAALAAALYGHMQAHQPQQATDANQIINSYVPSPPMYVDNAAGLYGAYNNAYGVRYNGGYHFL